MSFESGLSGLDSKLRQAGVSSYFGIAERAARMIDNLVGREEEEKIFRLEVYALGLRKQ